MIADSKPPSQSQKRIVIRLSEEIECEMVERAQRNHRSLSAEGAYIISTYLQANEKGA